MEFLGLKISDNWRIEPIDDNTAFGTYVDEFGCVDSVLYSLFKGVLLERIDLAAQRLPSGPAGPAQITCINYCTSGRCECDMGQAGSIVVREGSLCVSSAKAKAFTYPTGSYAGFELWLGLGCGFEQCDEVLDRFGIDLAALEELWCADTLAAIVRPEGETLYLCEAINALLREEKVDIGELRLLICAFLRNLVQAEPKRDRNSFGYMQRSQRDMARAVHEHISANPTTRLDLHAFAQEYGVSASSLRSYFERVYGQSPAAFARSLVMRDACAQLASTSSPVGDIAIAAGYGNPSKFSAAFKREMGVTPLEYRRRSLLAAHGKSKTDVNERM